MEANQTMELIQINGSQAIIFTYHVTIGYVSEFYFYTDAVIIDTIKNTCETILYNDLKVIYKQIEGKKERIKFWHAIKTMSPESIEEENARSKAEAISIVE